MGSRIESFKAINIVALEDPSTISPRPPLGGGSTTLEEAEDEAGGVRLERAIYIGKQSSFRKNKKKEPTLDPPSGLAAGASG